MIEAHYHLANVLALHIKVQQNLIARLDRMLAEHHILGGLLVAVVAMIGEPGIG